VKTSETPVKSPANEPATQFAFKSANSEPVSPAKIAFGATNHQQRQSLEKHSQQELEPAKLAEPVVMDEPAENVKPARKPAELKPVAKSASPQLAGLSAAITTGAPIVAKREATRATEVLRPAASSESDIVRMPVKPVPAIVATPAHKPTSLPPIVSVEDYAKERGATRPATQPIIRTARAPDREAGGLGGFVNTSAGGSSGALPPIVSPEDYQRRQLR
jgi:hypothetical protein